MGWKAAVGFGLIGAAAVLAAEFAVGDSILKKVQHQSASAGGYTLQLIDLPATVGNTQPVAVRLTYLGQPVAKAPVTITVNQDSGSNSLTLQTDVNGMALFSVLAFNSQVVKVTGVYTANASTTVTDVMNVDFRSWPVTAKKG